MKLAPLVSSILVFLLCGSILVCAVSASPSEPMPAITQTDEVGSFQEELRERERESEAGDIPDEGNGIFGESTGDEIEEEPEEEALYIADPLYPLNKAMYHLNDKFYFWLLKPVAQGYSAIIPEGIRVSVSNLFNHITTPIRLVSNLLQLRFRDAGNEGVRFLYNSTVGICGFADAAKRDLNIKQQDEDLGQTLGSYGIGHGIYLVLPFLGPSSLRDAAGKVGNRFLNPIHYVNPTEASVGISVYDKVNETSFRIGDYEDLKKSAIDPYLSLRDAYLQYRKKKVED